MEHRDVLVRNLSMCVFLRIFSSTSVILVASEAAKLWDSMRGCSTQKDHLLSAFVDHLCLYTCILALDVDTNRI